MASVLHCVSVSSVNFLKQTGFMALIGKPASYLLAPVECLGVVGARWQVMGLVIACKHAPTIWLP